MNTVQPLTSVYVTVSRVLHYTMSLRFIGNLTSVWGLRFRRMELLLMALLSLYGLRETNNPSFK